MANHLRVHIVPVGHESTRITEPLLSRKADKVYFIRHIKDEKSKYYDFITKELENKEIEIREKFVDMWDLFKCIEKFKEIVNREKDNHVYVNVSTGSKISAIAGMLTSMLLQNVEPYYVHKEYSSREVEIKKEIVKENVELPVFGINQPKKTFLTVLDILSKHDKMKKSDLIEVLVKNDVIKQKNTTKNSFTTHAKHSQLRAILDPMERDWDFIKIDGKGRSSKVKITPQGNFALRIFSNSADSVE